MKSKRLIDIYRNPRERAIFYDMSQNATLKEIFQPIGLVEDDDFHSQDFDYMYNHAGLKTCSVMMMALANNYVIDDDNEYVIQPNGKRVNWDYFVLDIDKTLINTVIVHKFANKWRDLIETLFLEYDLLSPYSMEITDNTKDTMTSKQTDDTTASGTSSNTNTVSEDGSETTTNDLTDTRTVDSDSTTTNNLKSQTTSTTDRTEETSVYGFNSSAASPSENKTIDQSDTSNSTNTGTVGVEANSTDTNKRTGTVGVEQSKNGTTTDEGTTSSTRQNTSDYDRNNTVKRDIFRKGNIGNHTFAELISGERDMLLYQIFDVIYADLDSILTRSKYM